MSIFNDLSEMGAGALEVVKHGTKMSPLGSLFNIGRHTLGAAYDCVTGDRHGAVEHAGEVAAGGIGMLGGGLVGTLMGAGSLCGKMMTNNSKSPGLGEILAEGANGVIDSVFHSPGDDHKEFTGEENAKKKVEDLADEHPHEKLSTAQKILGGVGTFMGMGLGPQGMIAGSSAGRWLGGLF